MSRRLRQKVPIPTLTRVLRRIEDLLEETRSLARTTRAWHSEADRVRLAITVLRRAPKIKYAQICELYGDDFLTFKQFVRIRRLVQQESGTANKEGKAAPHAGKPRVPREPIPKANLLPSLRRTLGTGGGKAVPGTEAPRNLGEGGGAAAGNSGPPSDANGEWEA